MNGTSSTGIGDLGETKATGPRFLSPSPSSYVPVPPLMAISLGGRQNEKRVRSWRTLYANSLVIVKLLDGLVRNHLVISVLAGGRGLDIL
jgi:hypothetical protein